MKKLVLSLCILFTAFAFGGCSCLHILKKHKKVDPEIKPYLSDIIELSQGKIKKDQIRDLTIGFLDLESPVVGHCNLILMEIDIDRDVWNYSSYQRRLEILIHEIGHCVLHRYHTNKKGDFFHDFFIDIGIFKTQGDLWDGCPSSIMYPYDIGIYCFNKHYFYYIDELFERTSKERYESVPWLKEVWGGNL